MTLIDLAPISAVASGQLGLVALTQLRNLGISPTTAGRLVDRGFLRRAQPRVFAVAGAPRTWRQDLLACQLSDPSLVVAGRAALGWWGIPAPQVLEFTTPRPRHPRLANGAIVHRATDLRDIDVVEVHGLRISRPHRALLDAGLVWGTGMVAVALRSALEARITTPAALHQMLSELRRRGRTGLGRLREACAQVIPTVGRTELEVAGRRVLAGCAVGFCEQVELTTPDGSTIKADFLNEETKTVVEAQSFLWHSTPSQLQRDSTRQNALMRMGCAVLEYTWWDFTQEADRVRREIDETIRSRLAA